MNQSTSPDRFRDLIRGFIAAVAEELKLPGEFSTWGISSILTVTLDGRRLRIGTNGTNYWLEAELSWQELRDSEKLNRPKIVFRFG